MTFDDFYRQVYLPAHAAPVCRLFHFLGPPAMLVALGVTVWLQNWWLLLLLPAAPYSLAWLGHVVVRNQPTFFHFPLWSSFAYWKMNAAILTGGLRARG